MFMNLHLRQGEHSHAYYDAAYTASQDIAYTGLITPHALRHSRTAIHLSVCNLIPPRLLRHGALANSQLYPRPHSIEELVSSTGYPYPTFWCNNTIARPSSRPRGETISLGGVAIFWESWREVCLAWRERRSINVELGPTLDGMLPTAIVMPWSC
ncbi:hypothetical protein BDV59DRAFT_188095 [Aspergillus ambiguus]|uniref:uncharacterized protein n=1 Tax=Aspergillus ambiguus TaxID=176160 RepID=UPI003CCD9BC0